MLGVRTPLLAEQTEEHARGDEQHLEPDLDEGLPSADRHRLVAVPLIVEVGQVYLGHRSASSLESAGGGDRTHTTLSGHRILSPVRLPVPPPRRVSITCYT